MRDHIIERMKILAKIHITGSLPNSKHNKAIASELASLGFINQKNKKCLTRLTPAGLEALELHIKSKHTSV